MKLNFFSVMLSVAFVMPAFSQSLYVPSGSSGIGSSSNSNIGIGTSSPLSKLDVRGSVYIPNGNSYWIGSTSDAGSRIRLYNNGSNAYFDFYNNLYFRTGSSSSSTKFTFLSTGRIGVGTTTPSGYLDIQSPDGLMALYINHQSTGDNAWGMKINVNRDLTKAFIIGNSLYNEDVFLVNGNGKVTANGYSTKNGNAFIANDIGQYQYGVLVNVTANDAKSFTVYNGISQKEVFNVRGNGVVNAKKIYAESFEVRPDALTIGWFDYVFNENYELKTLTEVEEFIKVNKHLPDLPSELIVKNSGFNLAEMDGLLLKKIEELTLYSIQQQKEIELLKQTLSIITNNKVK